MGQLLGKETLFDYIDLFGFGEKTGVDLNGESKGIIFNLDRVGELELATTAFGQGVSVTPMQQVTAVSAVVNNGNLYRPYIVKNFLEPQTNSVVKSIESTLVRKVISDETSATMRYALESVVARGGGRYAYIDGYRIGGKTGTAQKVKDGKYLVNNYIMSFMSVLPANKPEVVLYVAIDNPKNTAMLSSYTTAPISRRIMLDIIDILDIEKQEGAIDKVKYWDDEIYNIVPNVIGMDVKEAARALYLFEVEYSGSGKKVVDQTPESGISITTNTKVRLMLGE